MSNLIKNGQVVQDNWKIVRLAAGDTPHGVKLPVGQLLVPLAVWQARRAELIHREYEHGSALGVWIGADENPAAIERDIEDFTVIAVEFDKFADGNSYETARLLRQRYGYRGELRAIGDVPHNKLAYLHELGFDAIAAAGNRQFTGAAAVAGFSHAAGAGPQFVAAA
jgi:uncharacterized protein (DUF934 family)